MYTSAKHSSLFWRRIVDKEVKRFFFKSRSLNPELLYGHDDDDASNDDMSASPSASATSGFKSSFAREIMQNVRNQNGPARRYLAISQQG
jgi:hypothetical protein